MLISLLILEYTHMHRPTFYTIWKRKSSEGFQALPYSVAFFSASLLLYYAFLKTGAYMIITINGIGCFIETVYLLIYVVYAPKKSKVRSVHTLTNCFLISSCKNIILVPSSWRLLISPVSVVHDGFHSHIQRWRLRVGDDGFFTSFPWCQ